MTRIDTKLATVWVILIAIAVLVGWDLYAAFNAHEDDTISEIILGWARKWTIVPFLFGVLMGHLFWPQVVDDGAKKPGHSAKDKDHN